MIEAGRQNDAMPVTAIVLCGGRSSRFGSDKTRALIEGRPLLDHVLDALPTAWQVIAVGPERTTSRDVMWVREEPVFGGPLAALATALQQVCSPVFALLGGDMPHLGSAPEVLIDRLASEPAVTDAVVARTPDGRLQPLLLAALTDASRAALPSDPAGASVMSWLKQLRWTAHDIEQAPAHDVDTPEDLTPAHLRADTDSN